MRKPKRSHLRRFSSEVVNSGATSPNQEVMASYNLRAKSLGGVCSTSLSPELARSLGILTAPVEMQGDGKYWMGERQFHGVDKYYMQILRKGKYKILKLYFSGKTFFLVEENMILDNFRRSVMYNGREVVNAVVDLDRITWVETVINNNKSASKAEPSPS